MRYAVVGILVWGATIVRGSLLRSPSTNSSEREREPTTERQSPPLTCPTLSPKSQTNSLSRQHYTSLFPGAGSFLARADLNAPPPASGTSRRDTSPPSFSPPPHQAHPRLLVLADSQTRSTDLPVSISSSSRSVQAPTPTLTPTYTLHPSDSAASASVSPTALAAAEENPVALCWAAVECQRATVHFHRCYNETGPLRSISDGRSKSAAYHNCVCPDVYENIQTLNGCITCLKKAGVDTDSVPSPVHIFTHRLSNFCVSPDPDEVELLQSLLAFLTFANAPLSPILNPIISPPLLAVSSLPSNSSQSSTQPTSSSPSSSSPTSILPPFLSQIPFHWPYTAYGVKRTIGPIASYPLPSAPTSPLTWLYHSLLWNPRPLHTPASAHGGVERYEPLLAGWTAGVSFTEKGTTETSTVASTGTSVDTGPSTTRKGAVTLSITQGVVLSKDADESWGTRASSTIVTGRVVRRIVTAG